MKNKTYQWLLATLLVALNGYAVQTTQAQDSAEKDKITYDFYGYISHEVIFDTHQSVFTRDGELYLFPAGPVYHPESGNLINENSQLEMLSLQSRLGVKIAGPDVLNAKLTGMVETDFFATSEAHKHHLRIRHAFMKLQWDKLSLTLGQYWHPMFTPELFPHVISFGAAVPFNPLNRSPQVRFDYLPTESVKVVLAALAHGYHSCVGPEAAQRNSGLPDLQFQLHLGNRPNLTTGFTAGYMWLQHLEETSGGVHYYSSELLGAFNLQWFGRVKLSNLTLQAKLSYGENTTHYVMIGGYGRVLNDAANSTGYSYANLRTYAGWLEAMYKLNDNWDAGIFAGQMGSLGSTERIDVSGPIWYTRAANMANGLRISPRISYTQKKLRFALEYLYSTADYGSSFTEYAVPVDVQGTYNHRLLFSSVFTF
jgi:hypothetical protein